MAEENLHQKIAKIEQVEKVGSPAPATEIAAVDELSSTTKVKFDDAVSKADNRWSQEKHQTFLATNDLAGPSPIDQLSQTATKTAVTKVPTPQELTQQGQNLQTTIKSHAEKIQQIQESNPDLKITPAQEAIVTNKLIHVDSSLKSALSQVGVEVKAVDLAPASPKKPLVKFLDMLSSSDRQLTTLVGQVEGLSANKELLTPTKLLAVQIKLNFVQQQLEFFTNVLNKAVEGTKTIMNVQV